MLYIYIFHYGAISIALLVATMRFSLVQFDTFGHEDRCKVVWRAPHGQCIEAFSGRTPHFRSCLSVSPHQTVVWWELSRSSSQFYPSGGRCSAGFTKLKHFIQIINFTIFQGDRRKLHYHLHILLVCAVSCAFWIKCIFFLFSLSYCQCRG